MDFFCGAMLLGTFEYVGTDMHEVCNLNLDVKDEITKVIRLDKKQTDLLK